MFKLERISKQAVPAALEKAERYRLLNEPLQAESICLDVLEVDPDNQKAIVTLLLSLSDQFGSSTPADLERARGLLPGLRSEYERAYYAGLIAERRATSLLEQRSGRRGEAAYELYHEAITWYEKARALAPPGHDDAILRSNTCVRIISRNPHVRPAQRDAAEMMLE